MRPRNLLNRSYLLKVAGGILFLSFTTSVNNSSFPRTKEKQLKGLDVWKPHFCRQTSSIPSNTATTASNMSQNSEKAVEVPIDSSILNSHPEQEPEHGLDKPTSSEKTSRDHSPQPEPAKAPYNPWADPASFPDGGLRAWLTVAGAAACFFVSWG
jgi:hypothetical protein